MKTTTPLLLTLSVIVLSSCPSAWARDYYVSPYGTDHNPGTLDNPFNTIQRAADVARAGDTIHVRAGIYRETVRPALSGSPGKPITITAYQDESVVLSAGDEVTAWRRHQGDIWQAAVDWDMGRDGVGNTLFVDGELKYEAREGAETDPILIGDWKAVPSGRMTSAGLTSPDLKGWGDDYWNGAKVRHHTKDWVILNSDVADYESVTGHITFARSAGVISQKHGLGCYIYDTLKALDRPGEWYKDRQTGTLYYQVEPGQNPNHLNIEFKRRGYGFDLRDRDYIRVENLTLRGLHIQLDPDTDHNVYAGNMIYAYDKGDTVRFRMSGTDNVFRDNEVAQTWGSVAFLSGVRHQLVNNYLHEIGYNGTTRVIMATGREHLISHNTVRTFSRSFLDGFPDRSEFCYNLFEEGATLSYDTGVFDGDSGRGNGGACTIHHNLFRNTKSLGIYCAFYAGLDLVIHHNIVHDLTPVTARIGQLQFLKYYHNTWIGPAPTGNVNAASFAYESSYSNSLQLTLDNCSSLGVETRGNINYGPDDFVDFYDRDFRLAAGSRAIDAGIILPGINDGYRGAAPDAGALEMGQTLWIVGHDFKDKPHPRYAWKALPGTNLFGNGQFRMPTQGWTYYGSPVFFFGNAWNTWNSGLSRMGGNCYQMQPGDGISRVFTDLKPNTWYTVASETRLVDERIAVSKYSEVKGPTGKGHHRHEDYIHDMADGQWLKYEDIAFGPSGKYNALELTYSRPPGTPYGDPQATLEVRLDNPQGPVLGAFAYNHGVKDSWYATQMEIPEVTGTHTVYLLPRGEGAPLMRYVSVRFFNTNIRPDHQLTAGARDFGVTPVSSRVGEALWRQSYEEFNFKTGPQAMSAEVFFRNDGRYDAYLDRFAFFEREPLAERAVRRGEMRPSGSDWQMDLGEIRPLYGIRLTAPRDEPGRMSNLRVSAWDADPAVQGRCLWQCDYLIDSSLSPGETLVIKNTDRSNDGVTELQKVDARFVRVQRLGQDPHETGKWAIGDVDVLTLDETDLVQSDGSIRRGPDFWEASFVQFIDVGEIELCRPFAGELHVSVWDRHPGDGGKIVWEKEYGADTILSQAGPFSIPGDEISANGVTRLASVLARTVRIQVKGMPSAGTETIEIPAAIIRSAASVPPKTNVALQGEATQSSHHYVWQGFADTAINSVILPKGDFISTKPDKNAWWQVDLKQTPRIDQIVLYNRVDCADRIGNFRVSLWDDNPETGGRELWGKDYSYQKGDCPAGGSLTIHRHVTAQGKRLDQVKGARFVRVQLHGANLLHLSEVQVWTAPPGGANTKRFQKSTFHASGRVTHCHCEERSDVAISAVPITIPGPMRGC